MPVPISDLQSSNPSAIIELFQLQLDTSLHGSNTIYYWHNGRSAQANGKLRFVNQDYDMLPIEADGFDYNGTSDTAPRPTLRISNLFGLMTSILGSVNTTTPGIDLTGAKLTRIRTLAKYIDPENFTGGNSDEDHSQEFPREIYYIDRKSNENREVCEFELASVFDLTNVKIPKRVVLPAHFPGIGTFHG
tara:strand:+ start:1992 stop:2561 length:570 start_codon:yes stop_codon:yes gene_type:complete